MAASTPLKWDSGFGLLRSTRAYVLPRLVDVSSGTRAIVKSLAVAPQDVVKPGQTVAVLERIWPRVDGDHGDIDAKSPIGGLVARCRARVGDLIGGSWPILSIASGQDVMVMAHFPAESAPLLRRGLQGTVAIGNSPEPFPATIVTVIGPGEGSSAEAPAGDRLVRIVLSIPNASPEALWPGTPAEVEIFPWQEPAAA